MSPKDYTTKVHAEVDLENERLADTKEEATEMTLRKVVKGIERGIHHELGAGCSEVDIDLDVEWTQEGRRSEADNE